MNTILPLVVLFILAIPVALLVGLVILSGKVKALVGQLEFIRGRLAKAESDLASLKKNLTPPGSTVGERGAHSPGGVASHAGMPERPEAFASSRPPWPAATSPDPIARAEGHSSSIAGPNVLSPVPSIAQTAESATVEPPQERIDRLPPLLAPDLAFEGAPPSFGHVESSLHRTMPSETGELAPEEIMPPGNSKSSAGINWEQFMGVKLFAWLGGFALFLGVAFFIKYSFERNLIPPELRATIGFLLGAGLLIGGVLMKRRQLAVTAQTLSATGVVILYSVTFACHAVYHFPWFGPWLTFLGMAMITVTAFVLAVRLEAKVVAILGLVGGFLTPLILSTGQDNPVGLFSYVALLNLGLIAVAFHRRWAFLILMGAIGTVLMEMAWAFQFFNPAKVLVALVVFLGFDLLFLLAFWLGEKWQRTSEWLSASAIALPFVTLGFVFHLLSFQTLGVRPGMVFTFVWGADLCLLALVWMRESFQPLHLFAGGAVFVLLAAWTTQWLQASSLYWALGLDLILASLHTFFPVILARLRPASTRLGWGHVFPVLALLLILFPLVQEQTVSLSVWPVVLLIDGLAIGLAIISCSLLAVLAVLLLTSLATIVWLFRLPSDLTNLPSLLGVVGGFAIFFFVAGPLANKWILARSESREGGPANTDLLALFGAKVSRNQSMAQVPALSALLPFLLLILMTTRLPIANPSPIFGLALLLVVLLIGLAILVQFDVLVPISLACILGLEQVWHERHFELHQPWIPLIWYFAFYTFFTLLPFLFRQRWQTRILPWATSALAGPLQFYLIYGGVSQAFPGVSLGFLPAVLSVPMLLGLAYIRRTAPINSPMRLNLLAWFGGSALFFITLIFPIQFERQWLTLGWALEGLALIGLFRRVPHPGVRGTGVVLLAISFARLALNPAVLDYHRTSDSHIFNWYLYAYGVVAICLIEGARLLQPPRNLVWGKNMPPFLYTLGTVLAFLLLNIEIADFFSEELTLTFQFSGNFARDMSYSIGWALFALVLLAIGIWKELPMVRYAAIGLLGVTLLKLFFHDLSELGQLYRIGAFIVVAIILIVASFLYQRFVSFEVRNRQA